VARTQQQLGLVVSVTLPAGEEDVHRWGQHPQAGWVVPERPVDRCDRWWSLQRNKRDSRRGRCPDRGGVVVVVVVVIERSWAEATPV